jgi:hypothetical protein
LQLLQTIVLSITANVMPLLTSMRCSSEFKTKRLDQLRKQIARSTLRLQGSTRHGYVTAEAGLGDVMGDVTQHRIRLWLSLAHHPLRDLPEPPIACRVFDIVEAEAKHFRVGPKQPSLLLAPWPFVTQRIAGSILQACNVAGPAWQPPTERREVGPYASVVARLGEQVRWIAKMQQGIHWMCDSFALRPPAGAKSQTTALYWTSRLQSTDAGPIPKLWPLSYRGPHGCAIVRLARLRSDLTFVISGMRQGNASMQRFPFVASTLKRINGKTKGKNAKGAACFNGHKSWKTCRLCVKGKAGPRYDLWHVLFECPVTCDIADIVAVREACKAFLPKLCDAIDDAVARNAESMSNTQNAGVSHSDISKAVEAVRSAAIDYQWDCIPGKWLIYTLLLALPFPAVAVRPDPVNPIWRCDPSRRVKGTVPRPDLHGMPTAIPVLPDAQFLLPEAVGRLYDCTILSSDALRPLADAWCRLAMGNLLRAGSVVCPLRANADVKRAAEGFIDDDDSSVASTSSMVASSDSEP